MQFSPFSHLAGLFEVSLTEAVNQLKPERAFIAYRRRDQPVSEPPTAYATHGFEMAGLFVDEDISMELVRTTLHEGKPQLIVDAISTPGLTNRTSVIISGLRSVLTVPIRLSNGMSVGLYYLDNRVVTGAFKKPHEQRLSELVEDTLAHVSLVEQKMKDAPTEICLHEPLAEVKQQALMLAEKGHYTEGLARIEQWIRGREESVDLGLAYGVRGRILQQMGQPDSALESVAIAVYMLGNRTASANCEHYPLVLNNLAGLHVEQGNSRRAHGLFEAAEGVWNRLCRSDSRHLSGLAATQYNLGKLFLQMPDEKEAGRWFQKALDTSGRAFGPEHPRTTKIRKALEALTVTEEG